MCALRMLLETCFLVVPGLKYNLVHFWLKRSHFDCIFFELVLAVKSENSAVLIIDHFPRLYKQLKEEIRKTMEWIVDECVSSEEQKMRVLNTAADPQDFHCYKQAVKAFSKNCYNLGKVIIFFNQFRLVEDK